MKKNSLFLALLALVLVGSAFTARFADTFNVDSKASKITWKGEKVTGFHTGLINISKGSLQVEAGKLVGGSFEIDMNSITCTDLQGETAGKLVGHLKSGDFFNTAQFGTSLLTIKKVASQGKDDYKIIADLTIKGITKEIKFPAKLTVSGSEIKGTAAIVIDRSDFDIRYGSGSFFDNLGDKTIYDNFSLNVEISAKK